ncbi:glycosyltransferase 8 domain-containing protein 2 isoform X1 [Hyperolius riggenbachi]|uniref:glycosyltransferase 8 domain-containing protein 2 isoform X1 n=1 Tax=Hyperolius riggenbachi TaxID=752182 RepID=UPI0035A2AB73
MAILRKLNQILLLLLLLTICVIWYSTLYKMPTVTEQEADAETEVEEEDVIPVVICAPSGRLGGTIAAINSIYSNTEANVLFYIIGLKNTLVHIRKWIEGTRLSDIRFKIIEFNPMVLKGKIRPDAAFPELLQPLNFVRFYLPLLTKEHEKVIYLDDDIIVLGDIQELYNTKLSRGHVAAFSDDCNLPTLQEVAMKIGIQNTFMGFLDYRKRTVQKLGISPSTCSFNPGVFVANMTEWRQQHITKKLEKWMKKNVEENLYSSTVGGGVATPPMLIVFHEKYSPILPDWHVRYLGWSPDDQISQEVLKDAKLLHWNGRYKPWQIPSSHSQLWKKWYIPDPTGKFQIHKL